MLYGGWAKSDDTLDPKPELNKPQQTEQENGHLGIGRKVFCGQSCSRKVGQSGLDMSDQWIHLPEVADELCNYRGCYAESLTTQRLYFI